MTDGGSTPDGSGPGWGGPPWGRGRWAGTSAGPATGARGRAGPGAGFVGCLVLAFVLFVALVTVLATGSPACCSASSRPGRRRRP